MDRVWFLSQGSKKRLLSKKNLITFSKKVPLRFQYRESTVTYSPGTWNLLKCKKGLFSIAENFYVFELTYSSPSMTRTATKSWRKFEFSSTGKGLQRDREKSSTHRVVHSSGFRVFDLARTECINFFQKEKSFSFVRTQNTNVRSIFKGPV